MRQIDQIAEQVEQDLREAYRVIFASAPRPADINRIRELLDERLTQAEGARSAWAAAKREMDAAPDIIRAGQTYPIRALGMAFASRAPSSACSPCSYSHLSPF